jgi:pimeloyl-ACP methyl ester carboxylesterase
MTEPPIEYAPASDGVSIAYWSEGSGFPLVWAHEFAGSAESWAPQLRYFTRRYRVITYNARGYPPSDVPADAAAYSQDRAVDDLYRLLQHLEIEEAYIGGLSMGGATALHFGLQHPEMARALIVAGAGTGSTNPERFAEQCDGFAGQLEEGGMQGLHDYVRGPTRTQLLRKDPAGWAEFAEQFFAHSAAGSAHTLRGVQGGRAPIFDSEPQLRALDVPTLVLVGDEDEPCIEPAVFLKRTIPRSGLAAFPQTGHTINLEEPALFNRTVLDFLHAVEAGRWDARDRGSGGGFLT